MDELMFWIELKNNLTNWRWITITSSLLYETVCQNETLDEGGYYIDIGTVRKAKVFRLSFYSISSVLLLTSNGSYKMMVSFAISLLFGWLAFREHGTSWHTTSKCSFPSCTIDIMHCLYLQSIDIVVSLRNSYPSLTFVHKSIDGFINGSGSMFSIGHCTCCNLNETTMEPTSCTSEFESQMIVVDQYD